MEVPSSAQRLVVELSASMLLVGDTGTAEESRLEIKKKKVFRQTSNQYAQKQCTNEYRLTATNVPENTAIYICCRENREVFNLT